MSSTTSQTLTPSFISTKKQTTYTNETTPTTSSPATTPETSETPETQETTETTSSTTTQTTNYQTFYKKLISSVVYLLFSIFMSILLLYMCKVAQSNVVIDNLIYEPFGETQKIPEKIEVDVNVVKQYKEPTFLGLNKLGLGWLFGYKSQKSSTKVVFNNFYENENFKSAIERIQKIQSFLRGSNEEVKETKEIKNGEKTTILIENTTSGSLSLYYYLYFVFFSSLVKTFGFCNGLFGMMNRFFPESVLLVFFTFFYYVILLILFIVIIFIVMFYSFYYLPYIYYSRFPQNEKNSGTKNYPIWAYDARNIFGSYTFFTYNNFLAGCLLFVLFCLWFLYYPIIVIVIIFILFYVFLTNKGNISSSSKETNEPTITKNPSLNSKKETTNPNVFSFFSYVKSTFEYKNQVIILMFIYYLFNDVSKNLGTNYTAGLIIAIVLLVIFSSVLQSYMGDDEKDTSMTSGIGNFKVAKVPKQTSVEEGNIKLQPQHSLTKRNIYSNSTVSQPQPQPQPQPLTPTILPYQEPSQPEKETVNTNPNNEIELTKIQPTQPPQPPNTPESSPSSPQIMNLSESPEKTELSGDIEMKPIKNTTKPTNPILTQTQPSKIESPTNENNIEMTPIKKGNKQTEQQTEQQTEPTKGGSHKKGKQIKTSQKPKQKTNIKTINDYK